MPKTAEQKNPGEVLQSFIDKYQINPFYLSKSIKVAYQSVTNIIKGKARISVSMALRLSRFFGNSPRYWLDVQASSEIDELSADKKFISIMNSIPEVNKPSGKAEKKPKTITGKRKTNTLAEKRKKAVKTPGAKKPKGKKQGKPSKK